MIMRFNLPSTVIRSIVATALLGLVAGCSKAPDAAPTASSAPPSQTITISANDQMKFDVTTITAKAGERIAVTLKNTGTMPKASMGHNFVVLDKTQDPAKFVDAGQTHFGQDHIAPELSNKVIAHTKLLGPGETDTVTFNAPRIPGPYTFICSFPGHLAVGMKGTLTVQ
jgi:azurin